MVARRFSGRTALAVTVLLVLAVLPAGAADGDRAVSLRAHADHSEGRVLDTNGHLWIHMHPGGGAQVEMPPQQDAVEEVLAGPSFSVFGETVVGRRNWEYQRAEGSLADGTAQARSSVEDLYLHIAPLGVTITAESIQSVSRTDCDGDATAESAANGTFVGGLRINGETVEVLSAPNGPGQRFDAPEGRGYVEISTVQVEPQAEGNGWTTQALVIRAATLVPGVVTSPSDIPITHELAYGITETQVDCAA